jgi:branched-chain amino acid transport system permease protein
MKANASLALPAAFAASLGPSKPNTTSNARRFGLGAVVAIALIGFFFPQLSQSSFYTGVAVQGIIVAIGAVAVAFLLHQCGLCMFGIAGMTGTAAYLVAIASTQFGLSIYAALGVAALAMLAFSTLLGFLVVRAGHLQFAMITLAMAQMLRQLVQLTSLRGITGGDDGITLSLQGSFLGLDASQLADPVKFWPVAWAALCLVVVVMGWAAQSRLGTLLRAVQDNEERMRFSSYNTLQPRLAAFVLASLVASVSGMLTALHIGYTSPELLDFSTGGHMLTAALIGGVSTTVGPAVGGVLFGLANDLFSASGYLELLTGVAIVVAIAVFPESRRNLRYWAGRLGRAEKNATREASHA